MESNRENFASNLTAILALAGSAIGLGNIWRFPYMVGEYGGAAFIIVYLAFSLLISLPIMLSESIIGRRSRSNTFGALRKLSKGRAWSSLSLLTVLSPLIILSFYSVVGGWSIEYLFKAFGGAFVNADPDNVRAQFAAFTSHPFLPLVFHTGFLLLCAIIVILGVKSGIEKFNKVTMPLLFCLIVSMAIYSLSLPGSRAGVDYLLKPDFSLLSPKALASALGQSFFSLSLGVGTVLTYSSYISPKENILVSGVGTTVFDLLFALIAGFAVMPAVFAAGIEPGAGPALIFETVPFIFCKMGSAAPWISSVVAILFFAAICFAALSSAISMFEVGVAYLVEEKGLSRRKSVVCIFLGVWALGALCAYFPRLFSLCDTLTSNYLMMFGALLFVVFAGWVMKKEDVLSEFSSEGRYPLNRKLSGVFYFLLKWVAPIAVTLIFITNFLS